MNPKIDQKDINNAAWAVCDTFRGVMDAAGYKDYILAMLFVKYISDVWKDHYEEYRRQYGDDDARIRRKLKRERFVLPMAELKNSDTGEVEERFPADFYSLYERRNAVNIGELINIALDAIEEANKVKLEGVFRNIDFNSEANLGKTRDRNRRLKLMLEDFHKPQLDMRPSRVSEDVIGNTYIYLIERFASDAGKKAGEFYTPHKVSELVAKLAGPKSGDRICDPACGSGGLLIEAAREVGDGNYALFGMEVNGSTWALARMNMFLHKADSARIEWCNTLTSPGLVENDRLMKFNIVVANPPFSLKKWGAENAGSDRFNRFWRSVPPKSKGDWAFISHMVEAAQEKESRVSVVVPHGVLFRGAAEGRIRQKMIEENLLDTVVGLPGNLFPTTSIPVAILVFDRSREKGGANQLRKDVLFVDASREYLPNKNQNALSDAHIEKILAAVKARKDAGKYAYVATFDEIKENDFNLNIPRYVDTFEEEKEIDIDAVQQEIDALEKELVQVRAKMVIKLKEIER
ncbi:MAG: type I restriction-modification system subunit M [Desulfobacterales bacterium]|uniref:site-specific DNA-methyltransferase (adenine-specific) n=1 Tax=Candidatus Desulfatibia vada TaxID=2841696 RepID=A0A8J6NYQ9_9BACT|nr:type I restriction-modification system subunit M [Candidatus Desulfatibia vada]MBL6971514.1 type I restriction-modification system subunit M [Desulfobacterales bacterium]